MGILSAIRGSNVYLDANVFIYWDGPHRGSTLPK